MAKKIDPKAKAKRQKVIAGVGGAILLALLAFQVPRTMKMLNPPTEASASTTTTPTTATPATGTSLAAPSLSGGNATAAAPAGGDGLADTDPVPAAASGQLLAFGLFRTKDPFVQQIGDGTTGASGPVPTTKAGPTGKQGVVVTGGSSAPARGGSGSAPSSPVAPAAVTTAEISVNGVAETVSVGGQFPVSDPFFKLVSLTKTGAKISIAGGSLANGAPTVTLTKAKPLTLQNTSDGTKYVLRLLSVS